MSVKFTSCTVPTVVVKIYVSGDLGHIRQIVKRFVKHLPVFEENIFKDKNGSPGLCGFVETGDYIYTGGQESGAVVTLCNYPRFPVFDAALAESALMMMAKSLAEWLVKELCEWSAMIVGPTNTTWITCNPRDDKTTSNQPTTLPKSAWLEMPERVIIPKKVFEKMEEVAEAVEDSNRTTAEQIAHEKVVLEKQGQLPKRSIIVKGVGYGEVTPLPEQSNIPKVFDGSTGTPPTIKLKSGGPPNEGGER